MQQKLMDKRPWQQTQDEVGGGGVFLPFCVTRFPRCGLKTYLANILFTTGYKDGSCAVSAYSTLKYSPIINTWAAGLVTQSKSKTIITGSMLTISLIVFTDKALLYGPGSKGAFVFRYSQPFSGGRLSC